MERLAWRPRGSELVDKAADFVGGGFSEPQITVGADCNAERPRARVDAGGKFRHGPAGSNASDAAGDAGALELLYNLYETRILGYQESPPPEDWNGAFALLTK